MCTREEASLPNVTPLVCRPGSDRYDKHHYQRLNAAAFKWCEGFADDVARREDPGEAEVEQEEEEETTEEVGPDDVAPFVPEAEQEQPEDVPVATPPRDEDTRGTAPEEREPLSVPASPIPSALVQLPPPTEPKSHPRPKKAASQSPEGRAAVPKKPRARVPTPPASPSVPEDEESGEDSKEYVIEAITGGSHETDGAIVHRILWEGYPNEICWQPLQEGFQWDFDNDVLVPWRVISIVPPGKGPSMGRQGSQPAGSLYGHYSFAVGNVDARLPLCSIYRQNGVPEELDLSACTIDGVKVDWVVEMGVSLFADSVLQ